MKSTYSFSTIIFSTLLLIVSVGKAQSLSPLTIGTLHPGDSVVIYYDVTINAGAGSQISNQGTVSGSNFITLLTDDPQTAAAGDATITLLNMFPLPVTLHVFTAVKSGSKVELRWEAFESAVDRYEVERSTNGAFFEKIATVAAAGNGLHQYTATDATPARTTNYYRLKMIDIDGKVKYSLVIAIRPDGGKPALSIYPNPAPNNRVTLQFTNLEEGQYQLQVVNQAGQLVYAGTLRHEGGNGFHALQLPSHLKGGLYTLQVRKAHTVFAKSLFIE